MESLTILLILLGFLFLAACIGLIILGVSYDNLEKRCDKEQPKILSSLAPGNYYIFTLLQDMVQINMSDWNENGNLSLFASNISSDESWNVSIDTASGGYLITSNSNLIPRGTGISISGDLLTVSSSPSVLKIVPYSAANGSTVYRIQSPNGTYFGQVSSGASEIRDGFTNSARNGLVGRSFFNFVHV